MDNEKKFDKKDFDPKAAAEARKAELDGIMKKLETGVTDVFKGDNFKAYLNFCAKLPRYSINNQLLIMMQKPESTMCQSFNNWKEMGRHVKAGEKGIRILAPAPYKVEREQEKKDQNGNTVRNSDGEPVMETVEVKVNAFKPVSTFDISQTEGEPVPEPGIKELIGDVDGFKKLFDAIKEVAGVPIAFENIESGAKGYFHQEEKRIAIQEGMSEAQTVKTALHETAHAKLHSRAGFDKNAEHKSKNQKETEAEATAYVCCQHYGIETGEDYSFPYLATWATGMEVPELKASLDTIRGAASEIITAIDEKLKELVTEKNMESAREGNPFDESAKSEAAKDEGFIKIESSDSPKVPDSDKAIKLTSLSKSAEQARAETKSEKKPSVKASLSKAKEKAAKTPKPTKTNHKKDMQAAI